MNDLPTFPVDDQTLDMIDMALDPPPGSERTSIGELCDLIAAMGGSDPDAVQSEEDGVQYMRDASYHPNDVIAALVAEVRRLRAG